LKPGALDQPNAAEGFTWAVGAAASAAHGEALRARASESGPSASAGHDRVQERTSHSFAPGLDIAPGRAPSDLSRRTFSTGHRRTSVSAGRAMPARLQLAG